MGSMQPIKDLNDNDLTITAKKKENIFTAISCNHEATQIKLSARRQMRRRRSLIEGSRMKVEQTWQNFSHLTMLTSTLTLGNKVEKWSKGEYLKKNYFANLWEFCMKPHEEGFLKNF